MTDNSRYREFILNHPVMAIASGGHKLAERVQPIIDAAIEQHLMTMEYARFRQDRFNDIIAISFESHTYDMRMWRVFIDHLSACVQHVQADLFEESKGRYGYD